MRFIYIIGLLIFFLNLAQANKLKYETSPYLLQHANNPVNWYPYTKEAFLKAKKENKPIFLSIGYSTCHWCHVMAKESFENQNIARLLNKDFIAIKVDKEEMPQIDSFYQNLYKKVKGYSGGWPLNIFLTSDNKVFYMNAYIPAVSSDGYVGLKSLIPKLYNRYKMNLVSKDIQNIQKLASKPFIKPKDKNISSRTLMKSINENYDDLNSGFGNSSKFPEASKVNLMLDLYLLTDSKDMYDKSIEMLDAMALHGLYDQVDGGFFRYTVGVDWEMPHFEKMLYTQAQMISLYSRAYLMTGIELYKDIVEETIDMCDRRFSRNNLYFSASDAGVKGGGGRYFIFSKAQIKKALDKNSYASDIRSSLVDNSTDMINVSFNTQNRPKRFKNFIEQLKKVRDKRKFPFIDKKINTAWNALMIEALYQASVIDEKYKQKADKHLEALKNFLFDKGELFHQSVLGVKPKQLGFLEDYSFFISALIAGYEVDFDKSKLNFANYLLIKAKEKFYKDGIWYFSDDSMRVKADLTDTYYTSALSKMTQNIIKLAALKYSRKYEHLAKDTLKHLDAQIVKNQANTPAISIAYLMQKYNVVILKNSKKTLQQDMKKIKKIKYPFIILKAGKYKQYVSCTMKSCFGVSDNFYGIKKLIEVK